MDRTAMFQANSFNIKDELKTKGAASFDLVDTAGTYRPTQGQPVEVSKSGAVVYSGIIDTAKEQAVAGHPTANMFAVTCVGYADLFDRTIVYGSYDGDVAGDIIKDLITTFLPSEGITTTNVEDGPTMPLTEFNYISLTDALNDLASYSGLSWYIDYDKDLHFYSRTAEPAPWGLTDTSANFRNFAVERHREGYRNVQYIANASGTTGARVETKIGDGTSKSFTLGYPVAYEPVINQDGTDRTVGIKGVETGKEWYWNQASSTIVLDDSGTAPADGEVIIVTYEGLVDIVTKVENGDEVDARRAVEGGGGRYEAVESDGGMIGKDLTVQRAAALLRLNGLLPETITFQTDDDGLRAGMAISIVVSRHAVDGVYLISEIKAEDSDGRFLRYNVTAINGEANGGWAGFFRSSIGSRRDLPSVVTNGAGVAGVFITNVAWAKDALGVVSGQTLTPFVDTMIVEGVTTDYSAYQWANIGYDGVDPPASRWRYLLRFSLTGLAGQTITKATLRIYVVGMYYGSPSITINAHHITSSWAVLPTYATQPSHDAAVLDSFTISSDPYGAYVELDVTETVQAEIDSGNYYGFMLIASDETIAKLLQIKTKEDAGGNVPQLVVEF